MPGNNPFTTHNEEMIDAASSGAWEVVQRCLNDGADINFKDSSGCTALHCAVVKGYITVVETLLAVSGIDVNAVNNDGDTALHLAVQRLARQREGYGVVKQLLTTPTTPRINRNARDKTGRTALHFAVGSNSESAVELLLENGVDVNVRDKLDKTALDYAPEKPRDIAELLEPITPRRWASNKWSLALGATIAAVVALVATPLVAVCAGLTVFGLGKLGFSSLNKAIDARVVTVGKPVTPLRNAKSPILSSGLQTATSNNTVAELRLLLERAQNLTNGL